MAKEVFESHRRDLLERWQDGRAFCSSSGRSEPGDIRRADRTFLGSEISLLFAADQGQAVCCNDEEGRQCITAHPKHDQWLSLGNSGGDQQNGKRGDHAGDWGMRCKNSKEEGNPGGGNAVDAISA